MVTEQDSNVKEYLLDYMASIHSTAEDYIYFDKGGKVPERPIFKTLTNYVKNFLDGELGMRSFVLTGLRGAGKTTLLYQLFLENYQDKKVHRLFLSVDQIKRFLNKPLHEILRSYESIIGSKFENLDRPLLLFLDEVQFDKDWAILLKSIFDRTKKVCVFATGSSALSLNSSPDLARRSIFENIMPLSFSEYIQIKHGIEFPEEKSNELRKIIIDSPNAEELVSAIKCQERYLNEFWMQVDSFEIDHYLQQGSLPFSFSINNKSKIYEMVQRNIDRIINIDMLEHDSFDIEILNKVQAILYSLSDTDNTSLNNLSKNIGISKPTISNILSALEKAELLNRVYPYGSNSAQVRKSHKYLFSAPIFRSMYFNFIGNVSKNYEGKLLEDTVVMYLKRFFINRIGTSITYDPVKNSADFIINSSPKNQIVIEVGKGEKDYKQVFNSLKKVNAKYGLNISRSELELSSDKRAAKLPLKYFLLS